ncbi:MAG: hypothetical protein P8X98_05835 [Woeseiaceae bacterium]
MGNRNQSGRAENAPAVVPIAPDECDPNVLPLLASRVPADRIPLILMLTQILGVRGGVHPPWLPLAEAVSRALAARWPELVDGHGDETLDMLPRTALYLTEPDRSALDDVAGTDRLCVEACLARRAGRRRDASELSARLLSLDDPFARDGLSVIVPLLEGAERRDAVEAILANDSPVGLRGWMDLAQDQLLTYRDLFEIEQTLGAGTWIPPVVAAAELAPLLQDADQHRALLTQFTTTSPDELFLTDWYQANMLMGVGRWLDDNVQHAWLDVMNEPYRSHVAQYLAGKDDGGPDFDPEHLLQVHPRGTQLRQYLDSLPDDAAADFASQALDSVMDNFAGAGPPVAAAPPVEEAPAAPPRKRKKRSMWDWLTPDTPVAGEVPAAPEGSPDLEDSTAGAAEPAGGEPEASPTEPLPERIVQAAVLHDAKRRLTFVAGARNELICWIGPDDESDTRPKAGSETPVSEGAVPAEGLDLDVVLTYEDQTRSAKIFLPKDPRLRSADCILPIDIPADEVHIIAEVAFLHRGRAFEIVRIDAPALEPGTEAPGGRALRVRSQVQRREDIELTDRAPVDGVAIASDGAIAVFGPRGAGRYTLQHAAAAITWLNKEMFATEKSLVRRRARAGAEPMLDVNDPDTLALFRDLAIHGNKLYKELLHEGFKDPGERIQLFNMEPTAYVPLEFIYDRGHPVAGAGFCEGWEAALAGDDPQCGVCKPAGELTAEERDAMPTICPLGFWSLQKIIERHDSPPGVKSQDGVTPVDGAAALPPITSSLFACSHRVDESDRDRTFDVLRDSFSHADLVEDWDAWRDRIQNAAPRLIVALPHHSVTSAMDALEIGEDSVLLQDRLSELYVTRSTSGPGPVVVMFGCETQVQAEMGYVGFARDFARNRAAVVIGTLAKVLGRHAAPVAQSLVQELSRIDEPARLGIIMRRLRRRMLAHGYLMALCLVALGDGDWQLTPASDRMT